MFTAQFDKYACVNDPITCTIGKYTFKATIKEDCDSSPNDVIAILNPILHVGKMTNGSIVELFFLVNTTALLWNAVNHCGELIPILGKIIAISQK